MKIGMRTLKTVVASGLSMSLALYVNLLYAPAAGIIAILSVGNTKRNSFYTALGRLLSLVIATLLSFVCFNLLGYNAFGFSIFLLFFVPIAAKLSLTDGIVVNSVLVTHYLLEKSFSWELIANEFLLMIIGIGFPLLFNLYMPDLEKQLLEEQSTIEKTFKKLIKDMAENLNRRDSLPLNDACQNLLMYIRKGQEQAERQKDNQWANVGIYYEEYFSMRRSQTRLLTNMIELADKIWVDEELVEEFRKLLIFTAEEFAENNDGVVILSRIYDLYEDYRKKPLPRDREEFENRAQLFQFLEIFKNFIEIKAEFSVKHQAEKKLG